MKVRSPRGLVVPIHVEAGVHEGVTTVQQRLPAGPKAFPIVAIGGRRPARHALMGDKRRLRRPDRTRAGHRRAQWEVHVAELNREPRIEPPQCIEQLAADQHAGTRHGGRVARHPQYVAGPRLIAGASHDPGCRRARGPPRRPRAGADPRDRSASGRPARPPADAARRACTPATAHRGPPRRH